LIGEVVLEKNRNWRQKVVYILFANI